MRRQRPSSVENINSFDIGSELHQVLVEQSQAVERAEREKSRCRSVRLIDLYAPTEDDDPVVAGRVRGTHRITLEGDRILDRINQLLNKLYRSDQQKEFHKAFLAASLRLIFGPDFERHQHRIMHQYKFDSSQQSVLVCCPRRFGKTWSVAYFVLVFAICVPGMTVAVFSPGRRQSEALLEHTYKFAERLGVTDLIRQRNKEKMTITSRNNKESTIRAYPSVVKTLKGVSANLMILEEMAQLDQQVLYEVVLPLYQLDDSCLIGISTVLDSDNFMTSYLEMRDKHGAKVFTSYYYQLACKACIEAGRAAECNHMLHLLPAWSSSRKNKQIRALMAHHEELMEQEIGGVSHEVNRRAFPPKLREELFAQPRLELPVNYTYANIFIGIDPSGCGTSSDFAMATIVHLRGAYVLVGLESYNAKTPDDAHAIMIKHVHSLEKTRLFRHSRKIFMIEANLGNEQFHIKRAIEDNIVKYDILSDGARGTTKGGLSNATGSESRVGFRTTQPLKAAMVEFLRLKLNENAMHIAPSEQFVCHSHSYVKILQMLRTQMEDFCMIERAPNEIDKPSKSFSGKHKGKDDLVLAVQFAAYWSNMIYADVKYEHLR